MNLTQLYQQYYKLINDVDLKAGFPNLNVNDWKHLAQNKVRC